MDPAAKLSRMIRRLPIAGLAALAILSAHCMKAATPAQPLECRMEAVHPLVAGGPVALRFRLVNRPQAEVPDGALAS